MYIKYLITKINYSFINLIFYLKVIGNNNNLFKFNNFS